MLYIYFLFSFSFFKERRHQILLKKRGQISLNKGAIGEGTSSIQKLAANLAKLCTIFLFSFFEKVSTYNSLSSDQDTN